MEWVDRARLIWSPCLCGNWGHAALPLCDGSALVEKLPLMRSWEGCKKY